VGSVEEFGVGAGAGKDGGLFRDLVNEKPISSEVAFAIIFEVSDELVVSIDGWEGLSLFEEVNDFGEAGHVTSGSFDFFNVLFETFL
jgi:hypothetical protein